MKKNQFLLIIGALILAVAIFLRVIQLFDDAKTATKNDKPLVKNQPIITEDKSIQEPDIKTEIPSPASSTVSTATSSSVSVFSPVAGATIVSPLAVSGQAPGSWFFEATLPVKLVAADGTEIAAHYAQAMSDWMVPGLVQFTSILEFNTTATSGYLIVSKDNPSGLPENDASFQVPVNF